MNSQDGGIISGSSVDDLRLVHFWMRLPFLNPIPHGTNYLIGDLAHLDAGGLDLGTGRIPLVSVSFADVDVSATRAARDAYSEGFRQLTEGAAVAPDEVVIRQSWAVAWTPNTGWPSEPEGDFTTPDAVGSVWFERCIHAVNRIIRASRVVGPHTRMRTLTKDSMDPAVAFSMVNPATEEWGPTRFIDLRSSAEPARFSPDQREHVQALVNLQVEGELRGQSHPYLTYWELRSRAADALGGGDYDYGVLLLQTAAESLIRNTYRMASRDSAGSQTPGAPSPGRSFENIVFEHLPKLLGGTWVKSGRGAIPEYWKGLYLVRNRIAHLGHSATWAEAQRASQALLDLEDYIVERLMFSPSKYLRTLLAILGPERSEGLAASSNNMRRRVEEILREPEPFWVI